MKAPCLPRQHTKEDISTNRTSKRDSILLQQQQQHGRGVVDEGAKGIRMKDVMLHDERVLKERRTGAFKNYTYRGPDLGVALQRFTEAFDTD